MSKHTMVVEEVSTSGLDVSWIQPMTCGSKLWGYQLQQCRMSIDPNDSITMLHNVTGWKNVPVPVLDWKFVEYDKYGMPVVVEKEKEGSGSRISSRPGSKRGSRPSSRGSRDSQSSRGSDKEEGEVVEVVEGEKGLKKSLGVVVEITEEMKEEMEITEKDGIVLHKERLLHVPSCFAHVPHLICGTNYIFRVRACNAVGWSPWTNISKTIRTASIEPNQPQEPRSMIEMTTSTALSLEYMEPMMNGSPILQWEIEKWQLSHDLSLFEAPVKIKTGEKKKKKRKRRSNDVDGGDDVDEDDFALDLDNNEEEEEEEEEEKVDPETKRRLKKERDRAVAEQPLNKWIVAGHTRGLRFRCAQLRPGIEYGFRVRCQNEKGWSLWSMHSKHMRTSSAPPDPVEGVDYTRLFSRLVSICWNVPKCNGEVVDAYEVLHQG